MAESPCASDAPSPPSRLTTVAVATGAAVVASLLGRKRLASVAAGVAAAAAGAKWLSDARREEGTAHDPVSTTTDLSPEVHPPAPENCDWVDHDAVAFGHVVPDASEATEMLKEKSLPLLDDEGLPVEHVAVQPVYPEMPIQDFPMGPLIWEPGRFVQSHSDGTTGETVWFGMQDVMQEATPHEPAPAVPEVAVKTIDVELVDPSPVAPMPHDPATQQPFDGTYEQHQIALVTPLAPVPVPTFLESPFQPAPGTGVPEAAPQVSLAGMGPAASPGMSPFAAAAVLPLPGASGHAPVITPKGTSGTFLPQPRRTGEMSGRPTGAIALGAPSAQSIPAAEVGQDRHAEFIPARGILRPGSATGARRHLEPLAPVVVRKRRSQWPLVLLLLLLVAVGTLFAVDHWQHGELVRKVQAQPWYQNLVEMVQTAMKPKPPAQPASSDVPKRGPWLNAAPEK